MKRALWVLAAAAVVTALTFGVVQIDGCAQRDIARNERQAADAEAAFRNGPCVEESVLLATTAGSPDRVSCKHPRHRIESQPATMAGEEIGAVVTCRCLPAPTEPK